MYRPLQTLSLAIDHSIWGQWATGYHLTSLLLHVACSAAETLRNWVRRAERDAGRRPGLTTDELEEASELLPSREATLLLAEALALSNDLSEAQDLLERLLSESPSDDDVLNAWGNVLWMMGDEASAKSMYQRALESNPDNHEAETNLLRVGHSLD